MNRFVVRIKRSVLMTVAIALIGASCAPVLTATTYADSAGSSTGVATGSDTGSGLSPIPAAANAQQPPLGQYRKVCILEFHGIDTSHPRWCLQNPGMNPDSVANGKALSSVRFSSHVDKQTDWFIKDVGAVREGPNGGWPFRYPPWNKAFAHQHAHVIQFIYSPGDKQTKWCAASQVPVSTSQTVFHECSKNVYRKATYWMALKVQTGKHTVPPAGLWLFYNVAQINSKTPPTPWTMTVNDQHEDGKYFADVYVLPAAENLSHVQVWSFFPRSYWIKN